MRLVRGRPGSLNLLSRLGEVGQPGAFSSWPCGLLYVSWLLDTVVSLKVATGGAVLRVDA